MRILLTTSALAMMMAAPVCAATVLAYNPTSPAASEAPSVEGAGVTGADLERGPGISQNSGNSFNSRGWTETDFFGAVLDGDFLSWGFTSTTLYDLDTLEIAYDRSNTGAMAIDLLVSADGVQFSSIFTDSDIDAANGETASIDLSAFTDNSGLSFLLFGWGATSGNGTFDIEPNRVGMMDAFGISITGEISAVPLPAALPLLAGALGVFGLIRRKA